MYHLRQTQYLKCFKSVMLYVTWEPEPTARPSCLYGFLSPLKINKPGVCYVHHTNCREWRYYFKSNFSQWIIFWKWQNYDHLYASTRILKNLLTCSLEYFYLFFFIFWNIFFYFSETCGYKCCCSSFDWVKCCTADGGNESHCIYIVIYIYNYKETIWGNIRASLEKQFKTWITSNYCRM